MSKVKKKNPWLTNKPNSAKTIIERAKREVPDFKEHYRKFEEQMVIGAYSTSTLFNYSRAVGSLALHFKKTPLELDDDEINSFLFSVAKEKTASSTYFKHMVYGLRFFFRLYDREDRVIKLPTIKNDSKLPVVLSRKELKRLFFAPQRFSPLQSSCAGTVCIYCLKALYECVITAYWHQKIKPKNLIW